ncbi:transcriptional regulator PAI 2-type, partial [Xylariales sp. PMI_506]
MHIPAHNLEDRPEKLREFIRQNPIGILTTALRSETHPFLLSTHVPWVVDADGRGDGRFEELGRLRGHIARANPQAKAIIESLGSSDEASTPRVLTEDVIIMFNGPVQHYVTPKFYQGTKPATGKVVPTWDYEAVEVYGKAHIYYDTKSDAFKSFLATQLNDLTNFMETTVMGYTEPWEVNDAPDAYINIMLKSIIGIEIEITSMSGRFKWSQEKPAADRRGVLDGFRQLEKPEAAQLAQKVEE